MKIYSAHHHHHPVEYAPSHTHHSLCPDSATSLYTSSPSRRKQRVFAQPRPSLHPRAATYPRTTTTTQTDKTSQLRNSTTTLTTTTATKTVDLTPCHSCHRAPKQKTDLDNYDNCASCAGRTCYICMRMCSGPRCGGRKICRTCCLEKGEEGETWCFACEQGVDCEEGGVAQCGGDGDQEDVVMG